MLENQLYTIESNDGNSFKIRLYQENRIFNAHFEGMPILPGVCIVRIATELSQILTQKQLILTQIINLKFLDVISPDEVSVLEFVFEDSDRRESDEIVIRGKVGSAGRIYTKFSLLYNVGN